ncbi:hypothetical protein ES703_119538 [subsurface metagenome]
MPYSSYLPSSSFNILTLLILYIYLVYVLKDIILAGLITDTRLWAFGICKIQKIKQRRRNGGYRKVEEIQNI